MNNLKQTFQRIIELSKKLHMSDEYWLYEVNEPISEFDISLNHQKTGVILPKAYAECMSVSNGFMVDFTSPVGYFKLYPVSDYDINDKVICIGWMNHRCLYFNPKNGDFMIEYKRYEYTPIANFTKEVLAPVVEYLELQLMRTERRHELLEKQKDNPLREYFDTFMEYRKNGKQLYIYPPLTNKEICDWEETHIKLPETYRNWLLLTGECILDFKIFYDLDHVFFDEVRWSENDDENKEYWCLATTSGYGTCLLLDPKRGKLFEFDHDSEEPWSEIEILDWILDDALEWIEEM